MWLWRFRGEFPEANQGSNFAGIVALLAEQQKEGTESDRLLATQVAAIQQQTVALHNLIAQAADAPKMLAEAAAKGVERFSFGERKSQEDRAEADRGYVDLQASAEQQRLSAQLQSDAFIAKVLNMKAALEGSLARVEAASDAAIASNSASRALAMATPTPTGPLADASVEAA